MKKVLLGMSGGIDSTYAALTLKEQGYYVEGALLRMHGYTEVDEAKASAEALGIPLRILDAEELFERVVIRDFCKAYQSGKTPNPCIVCNENVKLRLLFDEAMREGFDHIATGHYAKVVKEDGRYAVAMGEDASKDQSYMLYRLPQEILAKLLLPLSDILKKDVKAEAKDRRLPSEDRPESQEICFVRGEDYADYIERACKEQSLPGHFVDEEGRVLGEHKGIIHYTVGQRKGLGISAASRLFVREIRPKEREIVLSSAPLKVKSFEISNLVFSGIDEAQMESVGTLMVRVRYQSRLCEASLSPLKDDRWLVILKEEIPSVTPGQSAVFYCDGRVMLGGIIEKIVE